MKIIGTPTLDFKVQRTPKSQKLRELNASECNYLYLLGIIGIESLGACAIELAVPTQKWWDIQTCPVEVDWECDSAP